MASASSVTLKNQRRVLYYNAIINQVAISRGLKIGSPALTFADVAGAAQGALLTSVLEQQGYIITAGINAIPGQLYIWTVYDGNTNNPSSTVGNQATSRSVPIEFYNYGYKTDITYLYISVNGGPFNLSATPIRVAGTGYYIEGIIDGLLPGQTNSVRIMGKNKFGFGPPSDPFNITTPLLTVLQFTDPGNYIWEAPRGLSTLQVLVVGGGGGGGGCYSNVLPLGIIPWAASNPGGPTTYWISSVNGRMYKGNTLYSSPYSANLGFTAVQLCISGVSNTTLYILVNNSGYSISYNSPNITLPGYPNVNGGWYVPNEVTYIIINGMPFTMGVPLIGTFSDMIETSFEINRDINKASGGSGGGAGGQVYNNIYEVNSLSTYTLIVGAGGAGGGAGPGVEYNGSPGGTSAFDQISSIGGSGGASSMNPNLINNGYGYGGYGGFLYKNTKSQSDSALSTITSILYNYPYPYDRISTSMILSTLNSGDLQQRFQSAYDIYNRTYIPGQIVTGSNNSLNQNRQFVPGKPTYTINDIILSNPSALTSTNIILTSTILNSSVYGSLQNVTRYHINDGCCGFQSNTIARFSRNHQIQLPPFGQLYFEGPDYFAYGPYPKQWGIVNGFYTSGTLQTYSNFYTSTTGMYLIDVYDNGNPTWYGMPAPGGCCGIVSSNPVVHSLYTYSNVINGYDNYPFTYFANFSTISPPNTGQGGFGTGALVGDYASGMDGGSGVVIITYS